MRRGEPQVRIARRVLDGVLLLDKPPGITSSAAVQAVKRLTRARRVGHTGTLDPMATGLLPLCLGEATKFSGLLLDADKGYEARVRLGVSTDTGDAEGTVTGQAPVPELAPLLVPALESITGPLAQVPPMFSALKHQGRPLYAYARAGQTIEREARQVVVHRLELLGVEGDEIVLRLHVSKGTYVRSLAQALGDTLGCGAHLSALRRIAVGPVDVAQAIGLDAFEALDEPGRLARLLPVDFLAGGLAALDLDAGQARAVLLGQRLRLPRPDTAGTVRLYGPGHDFLGLGDLDAAGALLPRRMRASAVAAGDA